ncbi:MAG: VWA domain-containing protein [Gaiellaceae bacterium]
MEISFLTPLAGLVAVGVILPLVTFARGEQRAAHVRSVLRLAAPGGSRRQAIAAIVVLALLVGIGAAQPVLEQRQEHSARTDAQAFFLLDTSRSMLAAPAAGEATRFERATAAARRLRASLPELPVGIASLTDRVLPLVFPTANPDTFERVLSHSIAVDQPASREANNTRASALDATIVVPSRNFFRGPSRRLLVLFTDAETQRIHPRRLAGFRATGIETILVRIGNAGERIYRPDGGVEAYQTDPASATAAEAYAAAVGGSAFAEDELDEAIKAARDAIGSGRSTLRLEASDIRPLGPFVFLAALAPLGFLLWRRNLA